ncbi:WxL domain-containing protein [Bacillus cihuensis]|uniref:WxL domain-containing protein n=1 Tax=Bacillus cihuensis TaxID=1208599 RepID=UPI000424278A|nr:WxL domain-containing protein [Bacillus cihuensis]
MKIKSILFTTALMVTSSIAIGGNSVHANEIPSQAGLQVQSGGLHLEVDNVNLNPLLTIDGLPANQFKQNVTDVQSLVVKDFTGTKQGWSVYVESSKLVEKAPAGGFKNGTTALELPTDVLSLESTLVSNPTFQINNRLNAIDKSIPQKYIWAEAGTGGGINQMPADGEFKIIARNLSADLQMVDPVNYPNTATQYEATVKFSLVQGNV